MTAVDQRGDAVLRGAWPATRGRPLRRLGLAALVTLVLLACGDAGAAWYVAGLVLDGPRPALTLDPRTARGLEFRTVAIPGELGDAPAWWVPPTATAVGTWVIGVHGRGANRADTLYVAPTIAAAGNPNLLISLRNDDRAPTAADGEYRLGETEWRDVAAAITFARRQGATGVVLYGWSMGGAVVMTALRRAAAADAAFIRGVILDSPVLDWNATLDLRADQHHLPGILRWSAKRLLEYRAGLSLADYDQRRYAAALRVPVLLFVDRSDRAVAAGPSVEFAAARPDLVTLVTTTGGGHQGSWNVDPAGYKAAVRAFLAAHGR
jgi:pimeloyl-ACP methyl ester carboxylesterase